MQHLFLVIYHRSSKQRKENESISTVNDSSKSIFWFAATVDHEDESTEKIVREIKKCGWKQTKSDSNIKQKTRVEKQDNHHSSRFKLISHRRNQDKIISSETDAFGYEKGFEIFDVVSDSSCAIKDNPNEEENDDILCNSVKMLRQNLKIDDVLENKESKSSDYVYDLYFAPEEIKRSDDELLDIEFYEDLLDANEDDDEFFDDEDDSNDEDNWRNDYPDEEENNSSNDEDEITGNSTEEEDVYDYSEYRNRRIPMNPFERSDRSQYFETVASSNSDEDFDS